MSHRACLGTFLALLALCSTVEAAEPPPLPKVVLIGDSIRLGYAPLVTKRLAGQAVVVFIGPLRPGSYEFFDDFNPSARGHIVAR